MNLFSRKNLHTFFEAGTLIKACDSFVEIALGVSFYLLNTETINKIIFFIFGDELTERPRDAFWSFIFHNFNGITANSQSFWALIFIGHGLLKLFLVAGLYKKKMWVYPVAAAIFVLFIIYQTFNIIYSPSLLLEILTAYDFLFTLLIIHEYQYQKSLIRT